MAPDAKEGNQKVKILLRRGACEYCPLATSGASTSRHKEDLGPRSYVLVPEAGGLLLLATFYWLIDVKGWTKWTFFSW